MAPAAPWVGLKLTSCGIEISTCGSTEGPAPGEVVVGSTVEVTTGMEWVVVVVGPIPSPSGVAGIVAVEAKAAAGVDGIAAGTAGTGLVEVKAGVGGGSWS